jgi:hypothetical protein
MLVNRRGGETHSVTIVEQTAQRPGTGTIIRQALRGTGQAFAKMPLLFASAYGGLLLLAYLEPRLGYDPAASTLGPHNHSTAAILVSACAEFTVYLPSTLCLAPVAVAVHRFVIRGETTKGVISPLPAHTQLFAFWLLILAAVRIVLSLPGALVPPTNVAGAIVSLVGAVTSIVLIVVTVRLALMFPAIAIDSPDAGFLARAGISWRRSRGHAWYIFWCETLASVIVAVPGLLILYLMRITASDPHPANFALQTGHFPGVLVFAALTIVATATAAAAISWIYRALAEADAA